MTNAPNAQPTGAVASLASAGVGDESFRQAASEAIASRAITNADTGLNVLVLHADEDRLLQFDMILAITAVAGLAAAAAPLFVATGPTFVGALAAIGALGALKGLATPLPAACAHIVEDLHGPKSMSLDKLRVLSMARTKDSRELAEHRFQEALSHLERLGCVEIRGKDRVVLKERVVFRG